MGIVEADVSDVATHDEVIQVARALIAEAPVARRASTIARLAGVSVPATRTALSYLRREGRARKLTGGVWVAAKPKALTLKSIMERSDRSMHRKGKLLDHNMLRVPGVGQVRTVIADYSHQYDDMWLPQIRLIVAVNHRIVSDTVIDRDQNPA